MIVIETDTDLSEHILNSQDTTSIPDTTQTLYMDTDTIIEDTKPNGLEEYCFYSTQPTRLTIKFDSAASNCMSAEPNRTTNNQDIDHVKIRGFNGTVSYSSHVGVNSHGKKEYYVPDMPRNLVLLCAHSYASDGIALLHKDGGVVLSMNDAEKEEFLNYAKQFKSTLQLKVNNRTYEVDDECNTKPDVAYRSSYDDSLIEEAHSNTATRFFNTKVNVSNTTERILTLLLTGLSFQDWYSHVQHGTLVGIPRDVTVSSLNHFEHKYGRTPDIIRLALPQKQSNKQGMMSDPAILTACGQRVEIDVMEPDFNDIFEDLTTDKQKRPKLTSHGGAVAAAVCVDCYSGYVHGKLLHTLGNSIHYVKDFVEQYQLDGHSIQVLAADSGVVAQSMFKAKLTPEVEAYLQSRGIKSERAEPYNHNRGTAVVERNIRTIKELMRMAITYVLRNPNRKAFGFTTQQLLKLWGELFYWAIVIVNLKISPMHKQHSKYEVFKKQRPNMQDIRLLPIFSTILVYDENKSLESYTQQPQNRIALYVGPVMNTPGAIRAAVVSGANVKIKVTSRFTPATDGGGLNIHQHIDNHIPSFIKDTNITDPIPTKVIQERPTTVWTRRGEVEVRRSKRLADKKKAQSSAATAEEMLAYFADWSSHANDEQCYYSFTDLHYVQIQQKDINTSHYIPEDGYKAVTENIPKSFSQALQDPIWGEAARNELTTILEAKAMIQVDTEMAKDTIRYHNADLLTLFPVYEVKMRDGVQVYKVRLVGDGRTHYHAGDTYSSTPSREELLTLLHAIATLDWDFVHVDEKRAFLNAAHKGDVPVFAKFRNDDDTYYQVIGALYGMKTAPKDYQLHVAERFIKLGYRRLIMCSCIYMIKNDQGHKCVVFAFVDDFIFASDNKSYMEAQLCQFRSHAQTTEPIWDPTTILGIELTRDRSTRTIQCKMSEKINEACQRFEVNLNGKRKHVPMPSSGYVVKDYDLDQLPAKSAELLNQKEKLKYMAIVGVLVWISGIRHDLLFAIMYLTWFTKQPRRHHMQMAIYVLTYAGQTADLPLVLGGQSSTNDHNINVLGYSDASLGTAPKGRSTTGYLIKLSERSGAIVAKAKTTTCVVTSSFESELDGAASAFKGIQRIRNILKELEVSHSDSSTLFSDNKAMVEFIKGNGIAKGVRHMELRMWYLRDRVQRGDTQVLHTEGTTLPADKLTKLADRTAHHLFTVDIMGLKLLSQYNTTPDTLNEECDAPDL